MNLSAISFQSYLHFSQTNTPDVDAFFNDIKSLDGEINDHNREKLKNSVKALFDKPMHTIPSFPKNLGWKSIDALLQILASLEFRNEGSAPKWILESIDNKTILEIVKNKYRGMGLTDWLTACKEKLLKPEPVISAEVGELRKIWNVIIRFVTNLIDIFLIAFTLFDVGKDPQSAWEAQAMLDIYYKFFMIPAVIAVLIKILMPLAEWQVYATAAGVVATLMVLLTIYIRFIRPCPDTLPHCEANLTKDAHEGKIKPVFGRDQEVEELIQRLSSKSDVFLVGESGVGKNEIVKELARRIANGDVPQILKNRKVFLVNTASLVQGGFYGYADQMKILLNRIRDLNQVILFFDEVHVALKNNSTLSDFFKLILDRTDLMCIAATTQAEFNEHIKGDGEEKKGDPAFLRRFHVIGVHSMEEKKLKEVLNRHQHNSSNFIFAKPDEIQYLLDAIKLDEQFSKKAEPGFALSVLDLCISAVSGFFDQGWESKKFRAFKAEILSSRTFAEEDINCIRPLREINAQENNGYEETEKARKLFLLYQKGAKTRRSLFRSLYSEIDNALNAPKYVKQNLETKMFYQIEYQMPFIEEDLLEIERQIQQLSREIGEDLSVSLSKKVIDTVLENLKSGAL